MLLHANSRLLPNVHRLTPSTPLRAALNDRSKGRTLMAKIKRAPQGADSHARADINLNNFEEVILSADEISAQTRHNLYECN